MDSIAMMVTNNHAEYPAIETKGPCNACNDSYATWMHCGVIAHMLEKTNMYVPILELLDSTYIWILEAKYSVFPQR